MCGVSVHGAASRGWLCSPVGMRIMMVVGASAKGKPLDCDSRNAGSNPAESTMRIMFNLTVFRPKDIMLMESQSSAVLPKNPHGIPSQTGRKLKFSERSRFRPWPFAVYDSCIVSYTFLSPDPASGPGLLTLRVRSSCTGQGRRVTLCLSENGAFCSYGGAMSPARSTRT